MSAKTPAAFSRRKLRQYLTALDDVLVSGTPLELTVCGGASIMWRDSGRLSTDVDVLSPRISQELSEAAARVASAYGLRKDWLNDTAATVVALEQLPSLEPMFIGNRLTVNSISGHTLLATKLISSRVQDFEDAVLLIQQLGIIDVNAIREMVSDTYDWRFPYGSEGWSNRAERALEVANRQKIRRARKRRKAPKPMKRTRRLTKIAKIQRQGTKTAGTRSNKRRG